MTHLLVMKPWNQTGAVLSKSQWAWVFWTHALVSACNDRPPFPDTASSLSVFPGTQAAAGAEAEAWVGEKQP